VDAGHVEERRASASGTQAWKWSGTFCAKLWAFAVFRGVLCVFSFQLLNSSSSAFASFRSAVSNPFGESVVDFGGRRVRIIAPTGIAQQACEAGRRAQLKRFRGLTECDFD